MAWQQPEPRIAGRPAPVDIDILRAHARGEHRSAVVGCRACELRTRNVHESLRERYLDNPDPPMAA